MAWEVREESHTRALGSIEPKSMILMTLGNGAGLGFSAASPVLGKFRPELKGTIIHYLRFSCMAMVAYKACEGYHYHLPPGAANIELDISMGNRMKEEDTSVEAGEQETGIEREG